MVSRCGWCTKDEIYQKYHDQEWGVPLYEHSQLFELLNLEGQQAGLSWLTVLKKREYYRKFFFQFSIDHIAQFSDEYLAEQLNNKNLIRNRLKIWGIRSNAQAWLAMEKQGINVSEWLWSFVSHQPIINQWEHYKLTPTFSSESELMSKQLKKYGFKFVGSTICYAFMQASGMVNDHEKNCQFTKKTSLNNHSLK